ncbi:AAA family ATPase [Thermosynechococcus sp. B0]|uniref:AAA family ATPase n=1 Tax=unclassified Thermosynechococcus TaxID=2622553 RepID=UPI002575290F|nr:MULTISPECIES: AAA family ATPase [unclassified Thermosynechococcus]WJI24649.1 AAA family ATPase [Thermosynechococcus sp. B0]WJI29697.1 AAA family ATPase [Thermosynechococcus sp. B3]
MLQTLRIQNFALVAELEVTFQRGLNVLTGETGAGKSILLDAIDALLGGKLSARQLRSGTEQGCIEAIFTLTPPSERLAGHPRN